MKVYFTAAIYQREEFAEEYRSILKAIKDLGHETLTAFDVMNQQLDEVLHQDSTNLERFFLHWRKITAKAEAAVVEVSFPSTIHIGMEIGALLERGKPTICLYRTGKDPVFTSELHSNRLLKIEYTLNTVMEVLRWGLEEVEQMINRRFTFFISPELDTHLGEVVKKSGVSRSEYIRSLIEQDMRKRS